MRMRMASRGPNSGAISAKFSVACQGLRLHGTHAAQSLNNASGARCGHQGRNVRHFDLIRRDRTGAELKA